MVGANTVAADTMSMGLTDLDLQNQRLARGQSREPLRVLLSSSGRIQPNWKVFQNSRTPLVIFSTTALTSKLRARLPDFCDVWLFQTPIVPLESVLAILKNDYGLHSLVCEGGPRLLAGLVERKCVDELYLTVAPRLFGGAGAPTLTGLPGPFFNHFPTFRLLEAKRECDELHAHFVAQRAKIG
jgi:riboflavin biosynthesis pyrimidine reductase